MAVGGDDGVDEKKRPATVLMETETDGFGMNEETGARKRPSTVSMDMATDGDDVDEKKTHTNPCCCDWVWPLEEAAPIDLEAPLEERLEIFLNDSSHEPLLIRKGKHVDLHQLLFTPERDYLMKSNGQKVYSNELFGKYVLLFIFPLLLYDGDDEDNEIIRVMLELVLMRNFLWDKGCFEIVSVALSHTDHSNQKRSFECYSPRMTWPFIPFDDYDARERVRSTFGFSEEGFVAPMNRLRPYLGIVDPTGKLLQSWAWNMLNYYSHEAFPFTDEKIISLYEEEALMFSEGVSLKALLGTSTRDYVLAPTGEKVLIQDLEDKVVCIILNKGDTYSITKVFRDLKFEGLPDDFVPVYVPHHFTYKDPVLREIECETNLESICVVGLFTIPFGDPAVQKIWRVILRRRPEGVSAGICNVVGPHGSYVDSYALASMEDFGMAAYPFTLRRRAELVAQLLEFNFPYEQIWEPACHINPIGEFEVVLHPDCRISCNDEQKVVQKHVLCNKRLLILFGTHSCCEHGLFLCELKSLYKQKKGTDEEFEVIYISLDCLQSDFDGSTSRMPWFAFPLKIKEKEKALRFFEYDEMPWCGDIPAITAFERDGRYVGAEGDLHLKKDRCTDFPYVNSVADDYMKKIKFDKTKL